MFKLTINFCREYENPKVSRVVAVQEFDELADNIRSSLSLKGGETTTGFKFRGDVWRQHLAGRGSQQRAGYRLYERQDLQPLVGRGLLQPSFHYHLHKSGQGLSVLFPLKMKWLITEKHGKKYVRDVSGNLTPCPVIPRETLIIKVCSEATDGVF